MQGTRVCLSSGDVIYVDAAPDEVREALDRWLPNKPWHFVRLGERIVNPLQVALIEVERDIPSIHTPERLGVPAGA